MLADLRRPIHDDPAANGWLDVVLSYPGFHAVAAHRLVVRPLYHAKIPILPRFLSHVVRFLTGVEIHPGARLGRALFIDHGMGVVIGETAELGENVTLNQGVTLGGTSLERTKRHPTLGDNVVVGADALVLGAITVGSGSRIGAGSVVVRDVPPNSTVVGIPGRVVLIDGKPVQQPARQQVEMPDPNAALIARLAERVDALERRIAAQDGDEGRTDASAAL
ncbi:MAG: serine O-acetyltransferase [Candidatus Eremiobacteraeota bacterium]|nr:serine O-acetyltransferase [Candidatus Eremiobacteraeota bacterium]